MYEELKKKLEDPRERLEFEKSIEEFFARKHRKSERHKKYYHIFTEENIDKIYEKNTNKKNYKSRNMDILMDVLYEYSVEHGDEPSEDIVELYSGYFTSDMKVLGNRLIELIQDQGSVINVYELDK